MRVGGKTGRWKEKTVGWREEGKWKESAVWNDTWSHTRSFLTSLSLRWAGEGEPSLRTPACPCPLRPRHPPHHYWPTEHKTPRRHWEPGGRGGGGEWGRGGGGRDGKRGKEGGGREGGREWEKERDSLEAALIELWEVTWTQGTPRSMRRRRNSLVWDDTERTDTE